MCADLFAAGPVTVCPSGYIAVEEEFIQLMGNCAVYNTVGSVNSCINGTSIDGVCMMYAPANTTYSDETGSYEFTEDCPLEV